MTAKRNPVAVYLAKIGKKGGSAKSKAKTTAARRNGKKGGRPPKSKFPDHEIKQGEPCPGCGQPVGEVLISAPPRCPKCKAFLAPPLSKTLPKIQIPHVLLWPR